MMHSIALTERQYGREVVPPQILSVDVMRGKDVPRSASGPYGELPIAWVVHALGTFVNEHGPTLESHWFFSEGWMIFDDTGLPDGETLSNQVAPVYTPAPSTPHPSDVCGPFRLNVINDSYLDVVVGLNDEWGATVQAGETYLIDEWTTQQMTPPPPPWHVTITYRASNVQFFETTMYPPIDQQLTIMRTGVVQTPYDPNNGC